MQYIVYNAIDPVFERGYRKMKNTLYQKKSVLWLTMTAVLMAMNVVLSSFSIPVPGGHLYLNDIVIRTAAIPLDPPDAFSVGGTFFERMTAI